MILTDRHYFCQWYRLQGKNEVHTNEWRFLLSGGIGGSITTPNPAQDWLTDKVLPFCLGLLHCLSFGGIFLKKDAPINLNREPTQDPFKHSNHWEMAYPIFANLMHRCEVWFYSFFCMFLSLIECLGLKCSHGQMFSTFRSCRGLKALNSMSFQTLRTTGSTLTARRHTGCPLPVSGTKSWTDCRSWWFSAASGSTSHSWASRTSWLITADNVSSSRRRMISEHVSKTGRQTRLSYSSSHRERTQWLIC